VTATTDAGAGKRGTRVKAAAGTSRKKFKTDRQILFQGLVARERGKARGGIESLGKDPQKPTTKNTPHREKRGPPQGVIGERFFFAEGGFNRFRNK